jgi:outer membrane protein assembly factor BamB
MRNAHLIRVVMFGLWLIGGQFAWAQDWPQWRGPHRDNKVEGFNAPSTWPKELTKKWKVTVGIGESSPLLVGDKLYTFGRQGNDEVTLCLDASTGKEIWKDAYATEAVKGPAAKFPGTRSTPAVGEGKICTLGVAGVVSCLDAATGKIVWRKETKSKPQFYTSTSPMIVDGKCIVFVGALTTFDLAGGDVKWQWTGGGAPYGSPALMTVDGVAQVVTPSVGVLAGVSLADGKQLWSVPLGAASDYQTNFSTPLIDGATVIYSASSKGKPGTLFAVKIDKSADGFKATEVWKNASSADKYHAPLLRDHLVFGVNTSLNFFCLDAKSGAQLWTDKTKRGQCGCILDAGAVLLAQTSDKQLIAMKASNKEYAEVAKYTVADSETWCVPIVAGHRIFVKDKGGSLTLWTMP